LEPITTLRSRTLVLPAADIDTDQIIPARFLTTTVRAGLGKHLFADWRYDAQGSARADFILNQPAARDARILIAGNNFGCGSSREHAPWALFDYGLRAIVSTQIADIFRNNALKNGLLPVAIDATTHRWLLEHPGAEITIDVPSATLLLPSGERVSFPLEKFARHCLVNGVDELGFLLSHAQDIGAFERGRSAA
jgi:3-isopropylmalate/(R)-2-methylmalate dehydratase small subunit